jgi:hypothetical protein
MIRLSNCEEETRVDFVLVIVVNNRIQFGSDVMSLNFTLSCTPYGWYNPSEIRVHVR